VVAYPDPGPWLDLAFPEDLVDAHNLVAEQMSRS